MTKLVELYVGTKTPLRYSAVVTLQCFKFQCPLPSVCVWADRNKKMTALASDWPTHFGFTSATTEWNLTELDGKQVY